GLGTRACPGRRVHPRRLPDRRRAPRRVRALAGHPQQGATAMTNPFAADPSAVRGAITPLVTPFAADGSIDLDAIKVVVDWQLEEGTHGISIGRSRGEPNSQAVPDRVAA